MIPPMHQVLHAVAIKKHGDAAAIAALAALPLAATADTLASAVALGRATAVDGRYLLTPAGQIIVAAEYSRFHAGLRANAAFMAAYARFEVVNKDLKQLITDWQTREIAGKRVANDHTDRAYDESVIGRLGDLHERCAAILNGLAAAAPRLAIYARKLGAALERAEDGDTAWVSDARIDSYHTVWFELHEDLLRLVGRAREE
jgi:hypothetical protein